MNMSLLPSEIGSILHDLLKETFDTAVQIKAYAILNQHPDYCALRVSLNHPALEIVVKLAGPNAPYHYPFDRTALFHRLVAEQTSILMPEIIAVDVSYQKYPWRYLIKTYLLGEEWDAVKVGMNTAELADAYGQMGNAIAQLHQIRFNGFGEISETGVADPKSYPEALSDRIRTVVKNSRYQDMLLDLIQGHNDLFATVNLARLCHEDLHRHNILFRRDNGRWQLATILDFDKAWAGHYEIDLAKLELWTGMIGDGFWEAYKRLMMADDGYAQRRPIYQLLWCFEYAANTPQHLADTRHLCELLNLPIIEQFE